MFNPRMGFMGEVLQHGEETGKRKLGQFDGMQRGVQTIVERKEKGEDWAPFNPDDIFVRAVDVILNIDEVTAHEYTSFKMENMYGIEQFKGTRSATLDGK